MLSLGPRLKRMVGRFHRDYGLIRLQWEQLCCCVRSHCPTLVFITRNSTAGKLVSWLPAGLALLFQDSSSLEAFLKMAGWSIPWLTAIHDTDKRINWLAILIEVRQDKRLFHKQGRVHGPQGSIVLQRAEWMFWFGCKIPLRGSCIGMIDL